MKFINVIFIVLTLTSCSISKPGYVTRIQLNQDAEATEKDIELITSVLTSRSHETIKKNEKNHWKSENYRINLDDKKFANLENRYIGISIEYYYDRQNLNHNKNILEKIVVRVGNTKEGGVQSLKKEIDNLTDQIVFLLSNRFDNSLIVIQRKHVHPM